MNIKDSYILLNNLSFHAYHGVSPQETKVGNVFILDLKLKVDLRKAMRTDLVSDTVSYADVFQSVSEEMAIPSLLLENVCGRIAQRIFIDFPAVEEVKIKLCKRNPPMGADIESAGVKVRCIR
ncbi:dihydroneopterin aldolase [Bacteroides sp. 224]|uniref:dihydroneopterin aldolase n=1 Tax=Bacteroides sp. 224 TaxID=2302936 RepID=UPI0013D7F6F3|nr:dihydroneopterin aldolase [Bacteroides sp. 224]NDV65054.1 dihydroneopterin aldolase [Bacteroides sp. 224]